VTRGGVSEHKEVAIMLQEDGAVPDETDLVDCGDDALTGRHRGLSRRPSTMLGEALDDLESIERLDGYRVDMGEWFRFHADGTCSVCLAGATLVRRVRLGPDDHCWWIEDEFLDRASELLNGMRRDRGDAREELVDYLLEEAPDFVDRVPDVSVFPRVPAYSNDPRAFKAALRHTVTLLEGAGL